MLRRLSGSPGWSSRTRALPCQFLGSDPGARCCSFSVMCSRSCGSDSTVRSTDRMATSRTCCRSRVMRAPWKQEPSMTASRLAGQLHSDGLDGGKDRLGVASEPGDDAAWRGGAGQFPGGVRDLCQRGGLIYRDVQSLDFPQVVGADDGADAVVAGVPQRRGGLPGAGDPVDPEASIRLSSLVPSSPVPAGRAAAGAGTVRRGPGWRPGRRRTGPGRRC